MDHISSSITHLCFAVSFNQLVPTSVIQFAFGWDFNSRGQPPLLHHSYHGSTHASPPVFASLTRQAFYLQVHYLPPNIYHLTFGLYFNLYPHASLLLPLIPPHYHQDSTLQEASYPAITISVCLLQSLSTYIFFFFSHHLHFTFSHL